MSSQKLCLSAHTGVSSSSRRRPIRRQNHRQDNRKKRSRRDDALDADDQNNPLAVATGDDEDDDQFVGDEKKIASPLTIDDLSSMDASAYLSMVSQQAKSLPDVFTSSPDTGTAAPPSAYDETKADETAATATTPAAKEISLKSPEAEEKNSSATGTISKDCRREQRRGPVDVPIDGSAATLLVMLSSRMDVAPPPTSHHKPPADVSDNGDCDGKYRWVHATVANFSKLRSYLESKSYDGSRVEKSGGHCRPRLPPNRKVPVPPMKDMASWHVFCVGREEARGNAGGYYEDDDDFDDDNQNNVNEDNGVYPDEKGSQNGEEVESNNKSELPNSDEHEFDHAKQGYQSKKSNFEIQNVPPTGHFPTTSLLLQFDQVLTRTLFHHHVHYLVEWKYLLNDRRTSWIYALLARLEKPWHREECAAVRSLLRECCERRARLDTLSVAPSFTDGPGRNNDMDTKNDDSRNGNGIKHHHAGAIKQLAHLNTLIAITGIYFEQGAVAGGDGMDQLFSVTSAATPAPRDARFYHSVSK